MDQHACSNELISILFIYFLNGEIDLIKRQKMSQRLQYFGLEEDTPPSKHD
jgi:hypothetical protein